MNYSRLSPIFMMLSIGIWSCEGVELTPVPDVGIMLSNEAGESSAGEVEAGDQIAGDSQAGSMQAGDIPMPSGDTVTEPDYSVSGSMNPGNPEQCGEANCDTNAVCISGQTEAFCECLPRYEGDGESCSPQACPANSSGAPNCVCDEGYEGDLSYDLASRTWFGQCDPVITCTLITIREAEFINSEDINSGQEIHEACIEDEQSSEYYRFAFEAGEVYQYYGAGGSNSTCPTIENDNQVEVSAWPYSGGVLSDQGLFHASNLTHTVGECTYDILAVKSGPVIDKVYLAPSGRSCTSGQSMPITCGEGTCQASGEVYCSDGNWVEDCTPGLPSDSPDICDGIDSDCDGEVDEDFVIETTSCGMGVCTAPGLTSCVRGQISDSCMIDPPQGNDQNCDGLDDDCDGNIDESYVTQLVTCGLGQCQADGVVLCEGGVEVTNCTPSNNVASDENCDGIDQDCDGRNDEGFVGEAVSCGVGACAFNGLTRCIDGVAEQECTPLEPAEDDASCDGVDSDCDTRIDEDYEAQTIVCGQGVCATSGQSQCVEGEESEICTPTPVQGNDSSCDGLDQDCDGRIDESFVSVAMPCSGAGVFECNVTADLVCENGSANFDCESVLANISDTTCDGVDDDCDGQLDESYVSVEVSCGVGVCADTSTTSCTEGEVTDRCLIRSPTGDDSDCDGHDDDCDGSTDESFEEEATTCGEGICTGTGIARCIDGNYQNDCSTIEPTSLDESDCDGLDNDCDGRVDETYVSIRNACGFGVCAAVGSSSCTEGVESNNCDPLPATGNDADCDALDQDCDDRSDEHYPPVIDECGVGVCYNTAESSCVAGQVQNNCVELPQTGNDADCDALDNDCDSQTDESYPPVQQECGVGVCYNTAFSSCVAGQVQNNCTELPSTGNDADCDGLDNDCDAQSDESYQAQVDSCGQGVCFNTAASSCVNGQVQNNCVELPQTGDDSDCDGLDDDCDGQIDESYVSVATSCTYGTVCVQEGVTACVNGVVQDVCDPPAFFGTDNSCNNVDNDCDGRTDEHFVGGQYSCGTGVCASTGFRSCSNGVESGGSCVPNNHLASADNSCDNVDQDCDGSADEGYGVQNTSCGTGVCFSTGTRRCIGGSVSNSCVQGNPTGNDTDTNGRDDDCDGQIDEDACQVSGNDNDCDGVDNDCDGSTDEGYAAGNVSCGEGVCASTGVRTCNNGLVSSSCTPNNQNSTVDNTCNGVDNDCDGSVDEHYSGSQTTCGVGACERTGQFVCNNGSISNNCVAGIPSNEIPNNGIDEDCNGSDLTGPTQPSGQQFSSHTIVKYTSSGFKAVWTGTGFSQQQAAQQLMGYFTGQGFGASNTNYNLAFSIKIFYPNSPWNEAGTFGRLQGSRVKYFVDGFETVVQVDNVAGPYGDVQAGPRVGNFIYQRQ